MPDAVTQALIDNAISNNPPGTLGSDYPYDMFNTQVQYDPSDITYYDNSVDAIRSGAALGRDLPPVSGYMIPRTLPVNPISQLMATGALLKNEWPGLKEGISQGWDALKGWMPDKSEAEVLGAGTIIPFPPGGRKTPPSSGYYDPYERTDAAKRQLAIDAENDRRLRLVQNGGRRGHRVPVNPGGGIGSIALALAPLGYRLGQWLTSPLDEVSPYPEGPDYIGGQRAEDAARTGGGGYLEGIFPEGAPTSLLPEQPSPYGSLIPISHTGAGVGGDNIPETVYNMPWISGEQWMGDQGITNVMPVIDPFGATDSGVGSDDMMTEDLMYNPPFVAAQELIPGITPERFDDFVTESILGIDTNQPVPQNLQALSELSQIDPTIDERYTPSSQALQDIMTQVESFADIPTVQPGAETPWTPPVPVIPDIVVPPPAVAPPPYVEQFEAFTPPPPPREEEDDDEEEEAPSPPPRRAPHAPPKKTAVQTAVETKTKSKPAPRRVVFTPPPPPPRRVVYTPPVDPWAFEDRRGGRR